VALRSPWVIMPQAGNRVGGGTVMADEPELRQGSDGDWVAYMQGLLEAQGHSPGPLDGIFGPRTEAAVRAYQEANNLRADGIVEAETWGALVGAAGGGGGGGDEAQVDVPAELVALGAGPKLSDWSDEQRTAYFTGAGSEPREEVSGDDASEVEVLAIADTPDDGEAMA
jgi:peptidoglycan hydrolase-like protein with peptidoglycan-binding domain